MSGNRWALAAACLVALPFPDAQAGGKWRISGRQGGGGPRWSRDGNEILYATAPVGGSLFAVPIKTSGTTLEVGTPVELGSTRTRGGLAITADGKRILASHPAEATHTDAPLTVVVNWTKLLSQK
jgi:hypothetical protein